MKIKIFEQIRLEMIVFSCGMVGMILELVASRVVAPYFGNSLVVWTSLIGVILGSLSAGYYFGGKIADRFQSYRALGYFILLASGLTLLSAFIKEPLLSYIAFLFGRDLSSASLVSILILFGPASFILGIVSPYAARLRLRSLDQTGKVVGNLYALSTLGSIVGTFLAGFYLIPTFGNSGLLYGLSLVLILISYLCTFEVQKEQVNLGLLILLLFLFNQGLGVFRLSVLQDTDSVYSRILVRVRKDDKDKNILSMGTDNLGIQSAIDLNNPDELYFEYTKAYAWSYLINPEIKKALMIGGGGYSFPRNFLTKNPLATIDVVEIDPKMTELARKYFLLKDDPRLAIYHMDARSFIKNSKNKYEVIYLDAFSSLTPPPHLTTKEFMVELKDHLTENGFLMINMVSARSGANSLFWGAEIDTLKSVFPQVETRVTEDLDPKAIQNLMVIAFANVSDKTMIVSSDQIEPNDSERRVLTDDWSPVEFLTSHYYDL